MKIRLPKDKENKIIESIKHYFEEHLETEVGDLKASFLLDYVIQEIGPSIYNQAILDAQSIMLEKVNDLDSICYQPEFTFWKKQE